MKAWSFRHYLTTISPDFREFCSVQHHFPLVTGQWLSFQNWHVKTFPLSQYFILSPVFRTYLEDNPGNCGCITDPCGCMLVIARQPLWYLKAWYFLHSFCLIECPSPTAPVILWEIWHFQRYQIYLGKCSDHLSISRSAFQGVAQTSSKAWQRSPYFPTHSCALI